MTFQKGQSGNPAGRPSGRQAFIDRATTYLEHYSVEQLIALAGDRERFGKLSVYDGMVVRRIIAALSKGGGQDMDRLLDRVMGKPTTAVQIATVDSYADLVMQAAKMDRRKPEGA